MAKVFVRADGRILQPRDAHGAFLSGDDVNTHRAHIGRVVADLATGWIAGGDRRFDPSPDAVNGVLAEWFPSLRRCDPRKGIGSGQGTDTTLFDAVCNGVGFNVKLAAADKVGGTAGACVGTTVRPPAWANLPGELARYHAHGGRSPFVVLRAERGPDKAYLLTSGRVEWCIVHPLPAFETGLADALSRARGRGRPRVGEVLPDNWATQVPTTCAEGYSYQLCFRHARTDTSAGWTVGTVGDLRNAIAAAVAAPR